MVMLPVPREHTDSLRAPASIERRTSRWTAPEGSGVASFQAGTGGTPYAATLPESPLLEKLFHSGPGGSFHRGRAGGPTRRVRHVTARGHLPRIGRVVAGGSDGVAQLEHRVASRIEGED